MLGQISQFKIFIWLFTFLAMITFQMYLAHVKTVRKYKPERNLKNIMRLFQNNTGIFQKVSSVDVVLHFWSALATAHS